MERQIKLEKTLGINTQMTRYYRVSSADTIEIAEKEKVTKKKKKVSNTEIITQFITEMESFDNIRHLYTNDLRIRSVVGNPNAIGLYHDKGIIIRKYPDKQSPSRFAVRISDMPEENSNHLVTSGADTKINNLIKLANRILKREQIKEYKNNPDKYLFMSDKISRHSKISNRVRKLADLTYGIHVQAISVSGADGRFIIKTNAPYETSMFAELFRFSHKRYPYNCGYEIWFNLGSMQEKLLLKNKNIAKLVFEIATTYFRTEVSRGGISLTLVKDRNKLPEIMQRHGFEVFTEVENINHGFNTILYMHYAISKPGERADKKK